MSVARDESIRGGRPLVEGSKVTVLQVVRLSESGLTAEEIVNSYAGIDDVDQVKDALEWSENHPDEMERLAEDRGDKIRETMNEQPDDENIVFY
jgi:uncharacterized protein (DUF433 family)